MKKSWVLGVALVILCGLFVIMNVTANREVYDDETLMNSYIEYAYGDGYCGFLSDEYSGNKNIAFMVYTKDGEPYRCVAVERSYAIQIHERG